MKAWRLRIPKRVGRNLTHLPAADRKRIPEALNEMQRDPFSGDVSRLKGQRSTWRRRVGDYRIFFDTEHRDSLVDVVAVFRRTSTTYRS